MKIVVTGAAGFIGSNIIKGLNARGIEGYVGASTQTVFFAGDAHHRHRSLWADTVNSAIPVTVEHDIADH